MILDFEFQNFRSFAASSRLSLISAKRDTTHPETRISYGGQYVLKTAAIFGPNASGKSNVLKALEFVIRFVNRSVRMNPGDRIFGADPHRLDDKLATSPCFFKINAVANGQHFTYELKVTQTQVHSESLALYKGKRRTIVFDRKLNADRTYEWEVKSISASYQKLLRDLTRPNGLALSRGAELNLSQFVEVFEWFQTGIRYLDNSDMIPTLIERTARDIEKDDRRRLIIQDLLQSADLGISTLGVKQVVVEAETIPQEAKSLFTEEGLKSLFAGSRYDVQTGHVNRLDKIVWFDMANDESNGTTRFFSLLGYFLSVMESGGVIVVDELDCSLHPVLTCKIIEMFHSPRFNTRNAQLIFTSHDVSLMATNIFRRDQMWLTEKRINGASDLYSLYDFDAESKPRSDEAFEKGDYILDTRNHGIMNP